jgi:hypothetical protein
LTRPNTTLQSPNSDVLLPNEILMAPVNADRASSEPRAYRTTIELLEHLPNTWIWASVKPCFMASKAPPSRLLEWVA